MPAASTADIARLEATIDALATELRTTLAELRQLLSDTQQAAINATER